MCGIRTGPRLFVKCAAKPGTTHDLKFAVTEINNSWFPFHAHCLICQGYTSGSFISPGQTVFCEFISFFWQYNTENLSLYWWYIKREWLYFVCQWLKNKVESIVYSYYILQNQVQCKSPPAENNSRFCISHLSTWTYYSAVWQYTFLFHSSKGKAEKIDYLQKSQKWLKKKPK